MTQLGFRVKAEIRGAQPMHPEYPLLPGDLLVRTPDGTFMKEAPGLAVGGFTLSPEQESDLEIVHFTRLGLAYDVRPFAPGHCCDLCEKAGRE